MQDFFNLIGSYGFPMVVAGYLLVRLEPVIKDLEKSISLLTMVVAKQSDIDIEQMRQILDVNR